MMVKLVLTRTVTQDECPWLGRDYEEGQIAYRYGGYTYGCISPGGLACSDQQDEDPFFELPHDAVEVA